MAAVKRAKRELENVRRMLHNVQVLDEDGLRWEVTLSAEEMQHVFAIEFPVNYPFTEPAVRSATIRLHALIRCGVDSAHCARNSGTPQRGLRVWLGDD